AAPVLALPTITPGPSAVGEVGPFPDQVALPDGFRPEGIAIGSGPTAWFGSLADGDIYEVDLVTGNGTIVSEGPGTSSVGMKVDHRRRLFVAGGPAGDGRVVDTRTGEILAEYPFTDAPSFVNDVVLTRDTAWFTDSQQAQLYGLSLTPDGQLPDVADVVHLPLSGDWVQQPGFNANGIAETPDGSALLVVQSTTGLLFRVDPASGVATVVDLGGASLTAGDGLLVIGRTLYAVQNQLNQVAVVELNRAGTSGEVVDVLTSPLFDVPTTVASFGRSLYLPNARFNTPPTPTTTYTAVRIDR
ncbi:MAG: SMP-30/gluconolactonase/LRE family protein, partial [Nocardioidaceae bacterium]